MLKDVLPLIQKLQVQKDLTPAEAKKTFTTIIQEDTEGYFFFVFMAMLSTKGETAEELYGLCQTIQDFCPDIPTSLDPEYITDLSGTGGGALSTINVSTTASFIVAGDDDIQVAKQAFPSITSPTGSAYLFRQFGINVFNITPQEVAKTLESIGIIGYNVLFSITQGVENLKRHIRTQGEKGLIFRTPFNLMGQAYTPLPIKRRLYGMFTDQYLHTITKLFRKLGYTHTIVCHGVNGLAEISTIGKTNIVEAKHGTIDEYTIQPKDLGIKQTSYDAIKVTNPERNILDFLRILYGAETRAKQDLVLANAGTSLYLLGKADDLKDGVQVAEKLLEQGKPAEKLEELVHTLGNPQQLEKWKKKAEITS